MAESAIKRHPAGVPTGGQFAVSTRARSKVTLDEAPSPKRRGPKLPEVWFHGTTHADFEDLLPPDRQPGENYSSQHWNTDLGVHLTSERTVAEHFAANPWGRPARVAAVRTVMTNPAVFKNETQLSAAAVAYAQSAGLARDPDRPSYWPTAPANKGLKAMDSWLAYHSNRVAITSGFLQDLRDKGHDGIVYGNSYEGDKNHLCAIAFPEADLDTDWSPAETPPKEDSA